MRGEEDVPPRPDEEFTDALADLRAEGCSLLVVGTVPEDATARACRRMLGESESGDRERLLVFTDATRRSVRDRLPAGPAAAPGSAATLIDYTAASRGAATPAATAGVTQPSLPESVAVREVASESLGDLGVAVSEAIADVAPADPEPAELRVCFDSLSPLLEAHDVDTVFRFVHVLTSRVERARGLAHFHLPVRADTHEVRLLAPLFDAVVELRMADGRPEQRWRLRDAAVTTDWLAV